MDVQKLTPETWPQPTQYDTHPATSLTSFNSTPTVTQELLYTLLADKLGFANTDSSMV